MYSRTTPFEKSDNLIGTHQKIDRAARLTLRQVYKKTYGEDIDEIFPKINQILKFEGNNGPDGIKVKSPGKDEPWHFVEPYGDLSQMFSYAENHIYNLSQALKQDNRVRASFEAAWLAHAVTDALTPAHQYPMEDKIIEISGKSPSERDKLIKKLFLPGETWSERIKFNWEYIGPKGVMSTHMLYEFGVATLISPVRPRTISRQPSKTDVNLILNDKYLEVFEDKIKKVADRHYYQRYMQSGWNGSLARETKSVLLPEISTMVALSWLAAIHEAKK